MNSKQLADKLKVSETVVESVYTSMHKTTEAAQQTNCCACGFSTCEQMVAAILLDMKRKEDCVHYQCKNLLEEISNQNADDLTARIKVLAEMLVEQTSNLKVCLETLDCTMTLFIKLSSCLEEINGEPD